MSGAESEITIGPRTPTPALWMWDAVAGSVMLATVISQQTVRWPRFTVISAVPVPSGSPEYTGVVVTYWDI